MAIRRGSHFRRVDPLNAHFAEPSTDPSRAGRPPADRTPQDVRRRAPVTFTDLWAPLAAASPGVILPATRFANARRTTAPGADERLSSPTTASRTTGISAALRLDPLTKVCHDRKIEPPWIAFHLRRGSAGVLLRDLRHLGACERGCLTRRHTRFKECRALAHPGGTGLGRFRRARTSGDPH